MSVHSDEPLFRSDCRFLCALGWSCHGRLVGLAQLRDSVLASVRERTGQSVRAVAAFSLVLMQRGINSWLCGIARSLLARRSEQVR